jgi:hypothetical protein
VTLVVKNRVATISFRGRLKPSMWRMVGLRAAFLALKNAGAAPEREAPRPEAESPSRVGMDRAPVRQTLVNAQTHSAKRKGLGSEMRQRRGRWDLRFLRSVTLILAVWVLVMGRISRKQLYEISPPRYGARRRSHAECGSDEVQQFSLH